MNNRLVVPGPRDIVRHSWLNVLVGKAVPAMLFLGFFGLIGATPAIIVALAWSFGVIGFQRATGRRVAGLVILSIVGNTAKSVVTLMTGSLTLYFVQPTISTVLIGLAFLISIPLKMPLAERLVHDVLPLDDATASHPDLVRFFPRISALWAATSLMNGAITLTLLLTQPTMQFVVYKTALGPATSALTLVIGVWWFRRTMRQAGVTVEFRARHGAAESSASTGSSNPPASRTQPRVSLAPNRHQRALVSSRS